MAKIREKEEEFQRRVEEMAKKKEVYEKELAEQKERRLQEMLDREVKLKEANEEKKA